MRLTTIKFGVFTAISLVMLLILFNTMSNTVAGETKRFAAEFTNVSGLRPGDDVRAAGVPVGRIEEIAVTAEGTARVEFIVSNEQQVYTNTSMVVRYQNLLGQRYLALVPQAGETTPLDPGSVIPLSRTSPGFDLTALLNGFEPLFSTIEPEQVNKLAGSIIAVLQGQGGTIETLLEETAAVSKDLVKTDEAFGQVIENLTPVLTNMAAHDEEFDNTIDEFSAMMSALAKERTSIGESLDGLSDLSDATATLLSQARPDLARDVRSLRELAETVVDNRSQIATVFKKLPLALDGFSRPLSHGSWLNIYLCNLAIELGSTPINLGPANGPYSAVCR